MHSDQPAIPAYGQDTLACVSWALDVEHALRAAEAHQDVVVARQNRSRCLSQGGTMMLYRTKWCMSSSSHASHAAVSSTGSTEASIGRTLSRPVCWL
ncbi:hypothetical protein E2C01_069872 [Portunus trituberculatus]|uniref:Uncharacterized protein n=1 Tax=Portunus trituberculatus TaxID=210409 RepID=A0A5B7HZQ7_PORTR|nr:hypothetical protein [Portunus trituberculatus]